MRHEERWEPGACTRLFSFRLTKILAIASGYFNISILKKCTSRKIKRRVTPGSCLDVKPTVRFFIYPSLLYCKKMQYFLSKNSNFVLFCSHTYCSSTLSEERPSSAAVYRYTSGGTWYWSQVVVSMVQKMPTKLAAKNRLISVDFSWFGREIGRTRRCTIGNRLISNRLWPTKVIR
jgi:hypothetical protein